MHTAAQVTFVVALAMVGWVHVIFPLVLLVRARLFPRPVVNDGPPVPITVVLAAHDEADVIGHRIENLLAQDYPPDLLHVVVACDGGSEDGTYEQARRHGASCVNVINLRRVGKAAAMNAAIATATDDFVAFTDANTVWAHDALRALVAPFTDERVGGVAGDQVYVAEGTTDATAAGEQSYWSLDRALKRFQSAAGSVTSATGAIYALRRELIDPVPASGTDDFFLSTGAIVAGKRLVFVPRARAYETISPSQHAEFARKVRITTRGLQSVRLRAGLLNPFQHGFYAVQLLTHKVLRRLAFIPFGLLLVAAMMGAASTQWLRWAALAQLVFYVIALCGLLLRGGGGGRVSRTFHLPAFFVLTYAAAALATLRVVTGKHVHQWGHDRQPLPTSGRPTDGAT
jgi:cellulose synthase/poly-beta-1,6-N-acetylglucosamine synthase-like glycosyltransferase